MVNRIDQEIDSNFTIRGVKKNLIYGNVNMNWKKAEQKLNISLSKLQEYENASVELVEISEKIEQIQNNDLPKLLEQKNVISVADDNKKQLERAISSTKSELDPIKVRSDFLKKDLLKINKLQEEIRTKEKRLATLKTSQNEQKALELTLINELQTKQEVYANLKVKKQKMDHRRNLLQLLVEQSRIKDLIVSLKNNLNKAEKNLETRKELELQLGSLSKITRPELKHLTRVKSKLRDTRTRKEAMATEIKVIQSNQVIR